MYPLKFEPILKERLWGGTKLQNVLGKPTISEITGESWEISGVNGNISVVANGPLQGKTLQELIKSNPKELLGQSVLKRFGTEFPILIKFIDAKKDLSIQLHPDDNLARERHGSLGKTEMWYVMQADPDAQLIIGFNKTVSRNEYSNSLENNTLLELLNYESVTEGDTFYIKTGKIHAIGAGVLLAEIQQTSDITYRVFDFNRHDKNGKLRELHTEMAVDAIDYEKKDDFIVAYQKKPNAVNPMVHSDYFNTDFLCVQNSMTLDLSKRDSFTILMGVGGSCQLKTDLGDMVINTGETVLLPAKTKKLDMHATSAKLLQVTL